MLFFECNLDYNQFHEDFENKDSKEYYVEMNIDGFDFEVCVTVERCNNGFLIYKDREYYERKNGTQFEIKRRSPISKALQQLFDNWLIDYHKEYGYYTD